MSVEKTPGLLLRLASVGLVFLTTPAIAGTTSTCSCFADLNADGQVDGADLGALLGAWGSANPAADLDANGLVDGADLGALLGAWGPCAGPANDLCGNAQPVVGDSQYAFCTLNAGTDGPAIPSGPCTGADAAHDVWFVYHALSTGQLRVDTCGNADFDTVIAVYGSTIPGLSPCPSSGIGFATFLGCNDDNLDCNPQLTSKLTVNVVAGSYYRIRVGGYQDDSGSGVLTLNLTQPGQSCESHIDTNAFVMFQTVFGNTSDNPSTIAYPSLCFNGTPHGPTEWIRWESTCTGVVTVSTCNPGTDFDTVVTVLRYEFQGNCWDTYVSCNDDSSQPDCNITPGGPNRKSYLQLGVSPGEVLYFLVSGYNGGSGNYEMTIDLNCN